MKYIYIFYLFIFYFSISNLLFSNLFQLVLGDKTRNAFNIRPF